MEEIRFVDTTLRDGQSSVWAYNMRTGAMLAIAEQMDRCGFESMEFFSFQFFWKHVREKKENPWDWLRLGTRRFKRTRLRLHGFPGGFQKIPHCVQMLRMERVFAYGLTLLRTSNPWNDFDALQRDIAELREMGWEVVANIVYSVSPRHTDEYYAEKARQAAAIRPYRICLKDVDGLLTPERTRALVPIVLKNAGDIPVEFHAHCNNSLAPFNYVEAMKLGVRILHTAIPPLANGFAQPSIFNVAKNARALGFNPLTDDSAAKPVEDHFTFIAKREGHPIGAPREYDESVYRHQLPGGMVANLRHQLRLVGMEDKLEATLEEIARVRAEFGYPMMLTPLSQFVGSQAAINVIVGERYKEVTDETIQYALGHWGREGALLMDPNVKDKILSRPRAKDWEGWEPPEPSIQEVRRKFGGSGVSDEELILRVIVGVDAVKAMLSAGAPREYLNASQPLLRLVEELSKQKEYRQIYIRKENLSLRLEKRGGDASS